MADQIRIQLGGVTSAVFHDVSATQFRGAITILSSSLLSHAAHHEKLLFGITKCRHAEMSRR
jgi:hypothetical protein